MNWRMTLATGLLLGALGCGQEQTSPAPAPPSDAATAPAPAPAPAEPAPAPAPAATSGVSFACIGGDATRGATHYATLCASCHGAAGNGDGPASAGLNPQPAKHSDGAYMNALANDHLYKVVKEGGAAVGKSPLMAPWGAALNEQQLWDVVAQVRTLATPAYSCP